LDIRINLLLPELKARQEQKRRKQQMVLMSLVVIGLFISVYGSLFLFTLQARSGAERLREERQTLEAGITDLKYIADLQDSAAKTGELVRKVRGNPVDWPGVLWDMGAYLPDDVWIIDFSYSKEPGKNSKQSGDPFGITASAAANKAAVSEALSKIPSAGQSTDKKTSGGEAKAPAGGSAAGEVVIRGRACDQPSVSLFMDALKRIEAFNDVYCKSAAEKIEGDQTFIDFEIKATLSQTGQGAKTDGKAGG
jgi:type IV pilus assembly protein PilN